MSNHDEDNSEVARMLRYGAWRASFARASVKQLIAAFNREVGNNGWGTARVDYLHALHLAFEECGVDCSSFMKKGAMSFAHPIALKGKRIVLQKPVKKKARP